MIKRLFFHASSPPRRLRGKRGPWRRLLDYGLAAILLGLLFPVAGRLNRPDVLEPTDRPTVTDGDSLAFGAERVRLVGIDAPEYSQTCRLGGADYACGRRSREALVKAIGGREVFCKGTQHDRYGRLLAVCRAGDIDLNRVQVEAGWALAYGDYETVQRQARAAKAGMWAGTFERPQDWRRRHEADLEPDAADILAWIGDWLRQALRFLVQATYSQPMESSRK